MNRPTSPAVVSTTGVCVHLGTDNNVCITCKARDIGAPKTGHIAAQGSTLHCVFPARSFTQIGVGVDRP